MRTRSMTNSFAASLKRWHKPAALLRKWHFEHNLRQQCRTIAALRARPEAAALLTALQTARIPVAVYSDYEHVAEKMAAIRLQPKDYGISPDHLYGPEHFGALKPAARPFRLIAEALGVPAEKVGKIIVVGDRDDTDGEGARNAGMRFLQVSG
ncbi:MAG: hypothetical protein Ta2A_24720 [Treponemataceae bacterium]|nr:MAG: hypothetical protein Ta2A_24720 [Treponemataceae bacterium]